MGAPSHVWARIKNRSEARLIRNLPIRPTLECVSESKPLLSHCRHSNWSLTSHPRHVTSQVATQRGQRAPSASLHFSSHTWGEGSRPRHSSIHREGCLSKEKAGERGQASRPRSEGQGTEARDSDRTSEPVLLKPQTNPWRLPSTYTW